MAMWLGDLYKFNFCEVVVKDTVSYGWWIVWVVVGIGEGFYDGQGIGADSMFTWVFIAILTASFMAIISLERRTDEKGRRKWNLIFLITVVTLKLTIPLALEPSVQKIRGWE